MEFHLTLDTIFQSKFHIKSQFFIIEGEKKKIWYKKSNLIKTFKNYFSCTISSHGFHVAFSPVPFFFVDTIIKFCM